MFTRIVECTVKPDRKQDFNNAITAQVLPALRTQPGFVDLIGLISDDRADHAYVLSMWQSRGDADHFYPHQSPETELLAPFLAASPTVESAYVTTSALQQMAAGKAA